MSAAHVRNPVLESLAAGWQHLGDVSDAVAYFQHGGNPGRQQPRNFVERLGEADTLLEISSQQMKARAERPIATGRGPHDGCLRRVAILQAEFEQIEKETRSFIPS